MEYYPLKKLKEKVDVAKQESDLSYFYELLNYAEFLTKNITLFLVSAINEDSERTKYRYQFLLKSSLKSRLKTF